MSKKSTNKYFDSSEIISNYKKKKKEDEGSYFDSSDIIDKIGYEKSIDFETFESDYKSVVEQINTATSGWQTRETMKNTKKSIRQMKSRIESYEEYRKRFGTGKETSMSDTIKSFDELLGQWGTLTSDYGKYESSDDYTKALAEIEAAKKKREKQKTDNLLYLEKEIGAMESAIEEAEKKKNALQGNKNQRQTTYYRSQGLQPDDANLEKRIKSSEIEYEELMSSLGYESIDDMKKALSDKKVYYNQTKLLQNGIALEKIQEDAKFEEYAQKGNALGDEKEDGWFVSDATRKNKVAYLRNDKKAMETFEESLESAGGSSERIFKNQLEYKAAKYMTDDEFKVYNAHLGKGDEESANQYLESIEETLNSRMAQQISGEQDTTFKKLKYSINAGFDQFEQGLINRFDNTSDYIPSSPIQMASGIVRDSLGDVGFDVFGNSLGQVVYDVGNTTSNMLPSVLTSASLNVLAPGVGTVVGTKLMGMSAGGNAYQEMLNLGYDKDQAKSYAKLVGLSEAGLQYALGGISSLGGSISGKAISSMVEGIDNAIARWSIKLGMNALSEGTEESLQEILTPFFENLVLNYQKNSVADINWKEVAYSGMLGALSSIGLEGGTSAVSTYKENASRTNVGSEIRANENIQNVLNLANMTPEETDAYNLYTQYAKKGVTAENIKDVQLGHLAESMGVQADTTLHSKKATPEQKLSAQETLDKLAYYSTPKAEKSAKVVEAKKQAELNASELNIGEVSEITDSGNSFTIEGIKTQDGETVLVTTEGDIALSEVTLSDKDAMLVGYAKNMDEDMKNVFVSNYDNNVDIHTYYEDFTNVYEKSAVGYSNDVVLRSKGSLTASQVQTIHENAINNANKQRRQIIEAINNKSSKNFFREGKFNDSVIDYNNQTTDGSKVNWKDLNPRQREAITFVQGVSKALGINIVLEKEGKKKGYNGWFDPSDNSIHLDVHAGIDEALDVDTIIPTLSHEMTHWMKAKAIDLYQKMKDYALNTIDIATDGSIESYVEEERKRLDDKHPKKDGSKHTPEEAMDEIVARACEDMLANSKSINEFMSKLTESEQKTFIEKVQKMFKDILNWVNELLDQYKGEARSGEAQVLRMYKERFEELSKLWDEALKEAVKTNQAAMEQGTTVEKALKVGLDSLQFNLRFEKTHKAKLEEKYSPEASVELGTLMGRYEAILDIWKEIGIELNSKFLETWNNNLGKDRSFTIFKAQAGYKYNVELSSMCKKGVPLFEAIDTIVKNEVMKKLKTDTIGKAEKEILYDILKSHHFEIPCAICYVEQARQREGVIIDAFLNGQRETDSKGKVTKHKLGWNEVLQEVQKEMKAKGVDYEFASVDRSIATDNYEVQSVHMDEQTQEAFYNALKKIANKEIDRYNKAEGKNRKKITSTSPSAIKEVFKGTLPSNLKIFKTLFNEPNSRFMMDNDLLYSSATTKNLAMGHKELYSLFNAQGGVSGYKTKQGTVVYWGDILGKNFSPSTVRKEGGIRNQSNSDFQMYTLLDQVQMYIDFTAKGYYLQAYTKVLSELKLLGLSRGKINASLIPNVIVYKNADGTVDFEKTRANAGLDENGNPIFDDFEGINHAEAFMLLEDAEYSKSICGVCIGYSDNHILKLLDDNRIQQIIGFHDKTDNPEKRYRGAKYSKNYNGLNEATSKKDGKTVHIGFNQFVKEAEKKFKKNKKTESFEGTTEFNGKTYAANDIPRLATDLYLAHCESKGLYPAYSQGETDFSTHPNYYKLLADFGLYDSQGNYAPHRKVAYNMPEQVPYLDADGNKAYMNTKDYIKQELEKELKVRDDIAVALADQSENGIITEFIREVNKLYEPSEDENQFSDRYAPTFYSHMGKVVDDIKQDKIGANSVVNYLKGKGVKDEEIKWSGIETFLDGKKSVTKAELQEFVAGSMLQIKEQASSSVSWKLEKDGENYVIKDSATDDVLETFEYTTFNDMEGWIGEDGDIVTELNEIESYASEMYGDGGTRWGKYSLSGGSNYRELVFQMPNSDYSNNAMRQHWGNEAEGVLAHARIQDITTKDGKKMLFIEEIQSDWHNEGHKYGYDNSSKGVKDKTYYVKRLQSTLNEYFNSDVTKKIENKIRDIGYSGTGISNMLKYLIDDGHWEYSREVFKNKGGIFTHEEVSHLDKYKSEMEEQRKLWTKAPSYAPDIPNAPFKNNYHEYVLKRLIRIASEEGYDSIGWTTGKMQEERWSSDYEEGYRIEYDQDIPKFLRKYGKKWGATVGTARTTEGYDVWSMDITDAMKQSVLYEGQVMYSDRDSAYKTDEYYKNITPASRKDALHLNMLDERNIARYRREIDGVFDGSLPTGSDVIIGMPSNVLKEYGGVSDRVIRISQRIARKIAYPHGYKIGNTIINSPTELRAQGDMEGKHNLGISAVKNLPLQIADPIAITRNNETNSKKNSVVIWTNWITEDGKGVMLGLVIDGKGATGLQNNVSTVFQADEEYAKRFFENEKDILYTKNNKDINQLLSVRRYMPKARVDDTFIKSLTEKYPDVKYFQDRDARPYGILEEEYRLAEENKALKDDIKSLKYILKIEREKNFISTLDESRLKSASKYLLEKVDSTYDKTDFADGMREIYLYIADSPNVDANTLLNKCGELARRVMAKSNAFESKNKYFDRLLADIQKASATIDGDIATEWNKLAEKYPRVFSKDVQPSDMATELLSIHNSTRETAQMYKGFNKEQARISLASEIYNQYWYVSNTDAKNQEIQKLRLEHRKTMEFLRDKNKERLEKQRLASDMYYGKIINRVKKENQAKMKHIRELDARRDKTQRLKMDITRKAMTLNRWLLKNSKKEHINEELKPIVIRFLNTLDFSSKTYIDTGGQDYTKSDMKFAEALRQVHEMMRETNNGAVGEGSKYYGMQFAEGSVNTIGTLVKIVNDRIENGQRYVLNQLTMEELQVLDDMVSMLKRGVEMANEFHKIEHNTGVASLGQNWMVDADKLGQIDIHTGLRGWFDSMLNFKNKVPHYAFKMFGESGMKVFKAFQDGWDKFAFNTRQIIQFTRNLYTSKEVRAWRDQVHTFKHKGKDVKITTPQLMALYCLSKRTQALKHILKGGVHIADFKIGKKVVAQNFTVHFSEAELNNLFKNLTDKQILVAEKMQEFMNTVCAEWGNETTMELYGINQFGREDFYFPIKSDPENINKDESQVAQENPFFRLLNMSFTKPLEDNAENRIMVLDIFEVFAAHTSDMAKYNALALPVIDTYKLLNYREKVALKDGQFDEHSLKRSINKAYGKEATKYIYDFLKDMNGSENTSRDSTGMKFFSNAKIASVAANIRVALLQPTAYVKARLVMDNKYLVRALGHLPSTLNKNYKRAEQYCGMVAWKSMGFYDTDVSRGILSQITHDETLRDKIIEKSMKGAEVGDQVTLAYLWTACEHEIRDLRKDLKVGTDEFYQAIANRLREVIYATQVVDSTMTRSPLMRSGNPWDKMFTVFGSEPTLSLNMVQDAYLQYNLTKRAEGKKAAKKKHGKNIKRALRVYLTTGLVTSFIATAMDMYRDNDDEDEEEFMKRYFTNLMSDLGVLGKIPYVKDLLSLLQGYSSSRLDTEWAKHFYYFVTELGKHIEGDGNWYKLVKKGIRATSTLTGVPMYNAWRDIVAGLDKLGIIEEEDLED